MSLRSVATLCCIALISLCGALPGELSAAAPPAEKKPAGQVEKKTKTFKAAKQPEQNSQAKPEKKTGTKPAAKPAQKSEKAESAAAAEDEAATPKDKGKGKDAKPTRKDVLKRARAGVVLVTTFDALGEKAGFGSGCIVGPGLILTNYHVIGNAVTAEVQPRGEGDERLGTAVKVKGYRLLDEDNDLAVLAVEELPKSVHVLPVADPESVEQFDDVFAIGHPDGLKFTTSPGSVNGMMQTTDLPEQFQQHFRNKETAWIQTDAVIAGGSSGGPLLNEAGEIVGINTFRLTDRAALAVGAKHVQELLAKLPAEGEVAVLPVPNSEVLVTKAVAELQRDFIREYQQFMQDLQGVRNNAAELQKLIRRNNPGPACLKLCRELVKNHPGQPEAADALRLSTAILSANEGRLPAGRQYLDELLRDAKEDAELIPPSVRVIHALQGLPYSADLDRYLRGVIEGEHEAKVQAAAGVALISAMAAAKAGGLSAEAAELSRQIYDRFGDEKLPTTTVKETLQAYIDSQQFAIGSLAPDIAGEDDKGEAFKLSDYRGKVVVLDFWADWCPHCRNLYPHERELVERLKDKPFALVGVNGDEPDRAKRVIAAGTVTWRSFMDGSGGPIAEQYKVQGWPTIYVLDQEGRIRFEGIRGPELDTAINSLLGEGGGDEEQNVIASQAEWKHHAASDDIDADGWRNADFDDANWQAGAGPFGFGPISAATKIDLGEPGQRPLTVLFRKSFDRPDGDLPEQLLLRLRYADGVVVHLNGEEIYRDRLPAESNWQTAAIARASDREIAGISLLIDSAKLQPTQNCLAVELHLHSPYRAMALLDVSLSPPPDFAAVAEEATEVRKAELCSQIAQIGVGLPGSRELLEKWQSDESIEVRVRAAIAAAMHDVPVTMEDLTDIEEQRSLVMAEVLLNQAAWDAVARADLSDGQYAAALRRAKAGAALFDQVPKELQPRLQGIFNTLGVALYRNRRWEEAKSLFQESVKKRGDNPLDAAYLSLTLHQLGDADAAEDRRRKFAKLFESDDWKHDAETQAICREVDRVLGDAK